MKKRRWVIKITVILINCLLLSLFLLVTSCKQETQPPSSSETPQFETTPSTSAPSPSPSPSTDNQQTVDKIIIDHTCTNIGPVPSEWIEKAKLSFKVWYGHTSHGSQITTGMENLKWNYESTFNFNEDGSNGALSYQEVLDIDLGHHGDLAWEEMTRSRLNENGNDRNLVMWSWCGGASDNTKEGIDIYLESMNQLEIDFPDVKFVYMTGHLDGTGESGNLNIRNNQIRSYCTSNDKILFDFADIESYDPDGNYYLNKGANDNCDYSGGNWAEDWCNMHTDSDLCWDCECAHSQSLNCNRKGIAFWWMLARIAGWEGH